MNERTASKIRIIERRRRVLRLLEVYNKLHNCRKCTHSLRGSGFGDSISSIMLVGQSLHGECLDTHTQIPFIGPMEVDSGDVLFAGIEKAGLRPEDFWITNLVKCHPPGNRANILEEEDNCWPFLLSEIQIIHPKHIIALGNSAYNGLVRYAKIRRKTIHGKYITKYESKKQTLISTKLHKVKHPSWAMRIGPETEEKWINEFGELLKRLTGKG